MLDPKEILIGNLTASLNQSQRYIVIAFGASVFTVLLPFGTPGDIKAPIGPAEILVGKPVAIALSFAVFWVAAVMASFYVSRIDTIIAYIDNPELVIASVTYPSILTIRPHFPRYGATLLAPVLAVTALLHMYGYQLLGVWQIVGIFVLIAPHLGLAYELREAIGESVRNQRAIEKVCAKEMTANGATITTKHCFVIPNYWRDPDTFVRVKTEDGDTYFLVTHGRDFVRELTTEEAVGFRLTNRCS